MKKVTLPNRHTFNRMVYYTRFAFLCGASIAFICHSGSVSAQGVVGQTPAPDADQVTSNNASSSDAANYRYVSTLTTGPSFKYDITQFVTNVLPTDHVLYSNKYAAEINKSAIELAGISDTLASQAKELRIEAHNKANTHNQAAAYGKQADSLDALADSKRYESARTSVGANEGQFEANATYIKAWQQKTASNTDVLTSASLLNTDATYYYNKALEEQQKSDTSVRMYIKQGFIDAAHKDMETAVLKQQCAENIYISTSRRASVSIAKRIDSIFNTSEPASPKKSEPVAFGHVVFCVVIATYSEMSVPTDKANKLLQLASLGVKKHVEENGVVTYTVGEYAGYADAHLLNQELIDDGYTDAYVVTYHDGEQNTPKTWVLANQ